MNLLVNECSSRCIWRPEAKTQKGKQTSSSTNRSKRLIHQQTASWALLERSELTSVIGAHVTDPHNHLLLPKGLPFQRLRFSRRAVGLGSGRRGRRGRQGLGGGAAGEEPPTAPVSTRVCKSRGCRARGLRQQQQPWEVQQPMRTRRHGRRWKRWNERGGGDEYVMTWIADQIELENERETSCG